MRKAKKVPADELRSEYIPPNSGVSVRGKYVDRLKKSSNVAVLDPGCRPVSERGVIAREFSQVAGCFIYRQS